MHRSFLSLILVFSASLAWSDDSVVLNLKSGEEARLEQKFAAEDWSAADGVAVPFTNETPNRLLVGLSVTGQAGTRAWAPQSVNPGTSVVLFFDLVARGPWAGAKAVSAAALVVSGLEDPAGRVSRGAFRLVTGARAVGSPPTVPREAPAQTALHRTFTLDAAVVFPGGNAYDERRFSVEGRFTAPSGAVTTVPGWWEVPYQEYDVGGYPSRRVSGTPGYRLRFAPTEVGTWSYSVVHRTDGGAWVNDRSGSFSVHDAGDPAPIRLSPRDGRYFEDARGRGWFPLGANVAWYDSRGWKAYDRWFTDLAAGGGNFARLWLASWGFGYEWDDTGAGDYTARQDRAWDLDQVVASAEAHGIRLMLCFFNHGAFSTTTNPEWAHNPWNRANGGPLASPGELMTDPEADRLVRQRLRYAAGRWGASPALFSWELFNEANFADGVVDHPGWADWNTRTAGYLRSIDPGRHLVTTSTSGVPSPGSPAWEVHDFYQEHKYGLNDWSAYMVRQVASAREGASKPYLFGEYGISGALPDTEGLVLHEGMWAGLFSGSAGSAMLWWWDEYLETRGQWFRFGTLARFLEGEDLPAYGLVPAKMVSKEGRQTFRLSGKDHIFLWQKDKRLSWGGYQDRLLDALDTGEVGDWPEFAPQNLDIPAADGTWAAEFWDPRTGLRTATDSFTAVGGKLTVALPAWRGDVAVKLVRR